MPIAQGKPRGHGGARSGPHTDLVNACLHWLQVQRVPCWKNNTGSFKTESGGFVRASFPGCSDIIGIIPGIGVGRFLAIECKTGRGELTDKQKAFKLMVTTAGGLFIEARSTDDLRPALAMAGWSVTR